jgi:tRNA A37 threonylcarbamoyltransferase TsaD
MKSQVSILTRKREEEGTALTEDLICAVAYEFQEAVVEVLAKKLIKAGRAYGAKTL